MPWLNRDTRMNLAATDLGTSGPAPDIETFADELKPGTKLLLGQFTIDSFLSAGGFGITYLARDSLDRRMVVKECFPSSFCRRTGAGVAARSRQRQDEFRSIVGLFLQEAANLSQLDHPNIVKVHQVFEDNETAYMAMDWIDGSDLLATMEGTAPRLSPDQLVHALHQMLDALTHVHEKGFLHRDIWPDNILLDRNTGEPVLIDFGAARKDVTRKSRVLSGPRVVKDGYSPQEFYISGSKQAPCSDLYALAASFCHLVSGETPKTSQERLSAIANGAGDPQRPLAGRVTGYDPAFLAAIDRAMSIFPRDRLQSAAQWLALSQPVVAVASTAPNLPAIAPLLLVPEPAVREDSLQPKPAPQPDETAKAAPKLSVMAFAGRMAAFAKARAPRPHRAAAGHAKRLPASVRTVQLPFVADPASPGLVAARLPWSPDWVQPGGRFVLVNKIAMTGEVALQGLMAGKSNLARQSHVTVEFWYLSSSDATVIHRTEALPVVTEYSPGGGLIFEMQQTPTGVRTVLRAGALDVAEDHLQPGDILLAYQPTGEIIGTTTALAEILRREGENRVATFGFAVQRALSVSVCRFSTSAWDKPQ